jgi:uncharacterized membrane protein (DUF2068 family)
MIRLIAVFKFLKAALLIVMGLGALKLVQPGFAERCRRWVTSLGSSVDRQTVMELVSRLSRLSPTQLEALGVGAFLYATLFLVEGVGLWKLRRWAEYLTIIATGSFIPIEIYEIAKRVTLPRVMSLGVNLVVVGYLIWRLRRHRSVAIGGSAAAS